MAKSIRSKVKKRLRTVKRGVVKKELVTPGTKLNARELAKEAKLQEALSGHLKPHKTKKNAFRSDDPDAVIPQHDFRQDVDYRSGFAGPDAGYAVVGSNRPKQMGGGDAPNARVVPKGAQQAPVERDPRYARLMQASEQIVPLFASKKTKKRLKNSNDWDSKAFRWC